MLRKEKKKGEELLISMSDLPCTLSALEGLLEGTGCGSAGMMKSHV